MDADITIRHERPAEYRHVESIIRQAFYNLYIPGCVEHYLAHVMRSHADFIPELDFVAERNGAVIGSIMYTKASLISEDGAAVPAATFGPVCIAPEYQRRGYGTALIEYSLRRAAELGYEAIVIFGSPANYVDRGFKSCARFGVRTENGLYHAAMLVKELRAGALCGRRWTYRQSPVMDVDTQEAERYDSTLPAMKKEILASQEEFYILSRAALPPDTADT